MGPLDYFNEVQDNFLNDKYLLDDPVEKKEKIIVDEIKTAKIKPFNLENEPKMLDLSSYNFDKKKPKNANTGFNPNEKKGFSIENILGKQGDNEIANGMNAIGGITNTFSKTAESQSESNMNTLSNTFNFAKTGMSVGGPVGAAIGGGIGFVASMLDAESDKKKRQAAHVKKVKGDLEERSTQRERDYLLEKGEKQVSKLKAVRESQMNYVSLDKYN